MVLHVFAKSYEIIALISSSLSQKKSNPPPFPSPCLTVATKHSSFSFIRGFLLAYIPLLLAKVSQYILPHFQYHVSMHSAQDTLLCNPRAPPADLRWFFTVGSDTRCYREELISSGYSRFIARKYSNSRTRPKRGYRLRLTVSIFYLANSIHDPVIRCNLHIHDKNSTIIIQSSTYHNTAYTPNGMKIRVYKIIKVYR